MRARQGARGTRKGKGSRGMLKTEKERVGGKGKGGNSGFQRSAESPCAHLHETQLEVSRAREERSSPFSGIYLLFSVPFSSRVFPLHNSRFLSLPLVTEIEHSAIDDPNLVISKRGLSRTRLLPRNIPEVT